jgi:hypothetical protein
MCYHLFDLNPFIPAALKILPHTVFQADCFSDIDNLIRLIMLPAFPEAFSILPVY